MSEQATQTASQPLPLGAEESQAANRIFVNLRIGKIAQTSDKQLEGFKPEQTQNQAGTVYHFFAKSYDHITGYVTDIRWHTHTMKDGTVLKGWNITIDTTSQVYVLGVSSKDRPFQRVMSTLVAVDFEKPVMFVGFMGKHKGSGKPQKVLLLSQERGADNKPLWLQPVAEEKWLSRLIINKLKEGVELNEYEERNVSRTTDGKFNKDYPYIVENADGGWSFDTWNNFLHEQMKEFVIPNVQAANEARNAMSSTGLENQETFDLPEEAMMTGPAPGASPMPEDDIPF